MPHYPLAQFQALVAAGEWDVLHTREYDKFRENLGWSTEMFEELLLGLTENDFQLTAPNCGVNVLEYLHLDGLPGDQYQIFWDEANACRCSPKTRPNLDISLKIAVAADSGGQFAGLVTIHLSRW